MAQKYLFIQIALSLFVLILMKASHAGQFEQPERLVAIGDIHGDGYALQKILLEMNLIDSRLQWIGQKTHLVFMGDILDRGLSSRKALDLIIHLEKSAPVHGGRVNSVLGNHEMMIAQGDLRYFAKRDATNYSDFADKDANDLKTTVKNAFAGSSPYGRWIDSLPAILTVGNTLIMHAGIEKWITSNSVEKVNTLVAKWLGFFRGLNPRPSANTEWVVGAKGPLWTREASKGRISKKMFSEWLKKAGYERVIVGHTIAPEELPKFSPVYGDQLVMIDTAISSGIGGNLSAIEWKKGQPIQFHHFPRGAPPNGFTEESLLFKEGDGIDPMNLGSPQLDPFVDKTD